MFGLAETEALAGHEEAAKQWYRRQGETGCGWTFQSERGFGVTLR